MSATTASIEGTYVQVRREGHFDVLDPASESWRAVREIIAQEGLLKQPQQPARLRGMGIGSAQGEGSAQGVDLAPAVPSSMMAKTTRVETSERIVFRASHGVQPAPLPPPGPDIRLYGFEGCWTSAVC